MAEAPEALTPACALFSASGYVEEALLTDYVLEPGEYDEYGDADTSACHEPLDRGPDAPIEAELARARQDAASRGGDADGRFVIPVTIDDLAANGLLDAHPQACWERSAETLTARKADIAGLAIASDERIEACLLHTGREGGPGRNGEAGPQATDGGPASVPAAGGSAFRRAAAGTECGPPANARTTEIVWLHSFVEDGGARLKQLLVRLRAPGDVVLLVPKVHPAEMPTPSLEALGFRPAGGHRRYTATARPD
jgi:hypothetical protein